MVETLDLFLLRLLFYLDFIFITNNSRRLIGGEKS